MTPAPDRGRAAWSTRPTASTTRSATSGSPTAGSIAAPADPEARADRTIDARGYVVMPAGVDVHCHIAGPKVNAARMLRPEDERGAGCARAAGHRGRGRSGACRARSRPGYQYAGLGYTTAVDAAIAPARGPARPPRVARHAGHRQGVPRPDGEQPLRDGPDPRRASATGSATFVAWLLGATEAYRRQGGQPGRRRDAGSRGRGTSRRSTTSVDHFGSRPGRS